MSIHNYGTGNAIGRRSENHDIISNVRCILGQSQSHLVAADDAAVDVVGPPATVGLGAHDGGELVPAK